MDTIEFIEHIVLAVRCHEQYCKGLLTEFSLRASDMDVLMFLATHPDQRTAKDVCGDRLVAKSLVSASVDALVSRGLLARETDPNDRRRSILTLQPAADEIIRRVLETTAEYQQQSCRGISTEDLQAFERVLRQMRHNMNELIHDPANRKENP